MNTYSRALRHISMKDVKQKHHQKLIEQKIQEEKKKEVEEYVSSVMEEKRYDWREKLNEQMTTFDVFFNTLPATGDVTKVRAAAKKPKNVPSKLKIKESKRLGWRKNFLREFGEWLPISSGGPTNSSSQSFGYFAFGEPVINGETGQQITYNVSGIGGPDSLPTTLAIDAGYGDIVTVDAPTYNQLALAGYAPPMGFVAQNEYKNALEKYKAEMEEYRKKMEEYSKELDEYDKKMDVWYEKDKENQENISNYLKSLGTTWEDLRKNSWALQLGGVGGDIIGISNYGPDGYKVTVATQHSNALGKIHFMNKTDKSWRAGFAQLKSEYVFSPPPRPTPPTAPNPPTPPDPNQYAIDKLYADQDVNAQLDASQEFAQAVGADYMMGARVGDDGSIILPDGSIYIELGPGGEKSSITSMPEDPAFKAGGGFTKMDQGFSYDQIIALGRKNIANQIQKANTTSGFDTLKQPLVGPVVVGSKAVGKGYSDVLDKVANTFNVGTAKKVFDYHMNWQKNPTSKPQDVTALLSPSDKKALQDLVNRYANDRIGPEYGINSDLQRIINANPGLRNSLGNMDWNRGDGAKIVGNNVVIKKAYDFGGNIDIVGAGLLTFVPAGVYGASKLGTRALTGTDTMNMVVKIPLKKSRKESTTWDRIKKYLKGD